MKKFEVGEVVYFGDIKRTVITVEFLNVVQLGWFEEFYYRTGWFTSNHVLTEKEYKIQKRIERINEICNE
jgi:hypothetical protein